MDYKNAGVDIEAGYQSVELMKNYVKETMRPEVLGGIGGFSGAFSLEKIKNMEKPTLVSGTDGVGTKIKLAFLMDRHDTVGIDCVAMCVMILPVQAVNHYFSLIILRVERMSPRRLRRLSRGWLRAASSAAQRSLAARPQSIRG